jgi:predicted RNase H-like nuclease (RuvC/YqgF family)
VYWCRNLPVCPSCGTANDTPSKVFTVIVEPNEGERGLTQRKVGMYQCSKCSTKYPIIVSRQRYLVVAEDQLKKIQGDVKDLRAVNQELEKKINNLTKDQEQLQETLKQKENESQLKQLEVKVQALQGQVSYLRKEKGELEERVSKFR